MIYKTKSLYDHWFDQMKIYSHFGRLIRVGVKIKIWIYKPCKFVGCGYLIEINKVYLTLLFVLLFFFLKIFTLQLIKSEVLLSYIKLPP